MFHSLLCYSYTEEDRAAIARYATRNGVTAASRYFTRKLKTPVNKSTVHYMYIKQSYIHVQCVKLARGRNEDVPETLPPKKRGRHLLLGEKLDQQVQFKKS